MSHNSEINYNKSFALALILNSIYIIAELFYGFTYDSIALISDAGHNFSDVLTLGIAWGASILAKKVIAKNKTYGYRKSTILAALVNSVVIIFAVGAIAVESIQRLFDPQPVNGAIITFVAGIGILINFLTALLFLKGRKHDLNIKGAFIHMAGDTAVSLGVVIGGFLILKTGYFLIDPVISIIIVIIILISAWSLLKESLNMALDGVPQSIIIEEVRDFILNYSEVENIHDLHIWSLSTTEIALSAHIIKENQVTNDEFLEKIYQDLHDKFNIHHTTIQIETNSLINNMHCDCGEM